MQLAINSNIKYTAVWKLLLNITLQTADTGQSFRVFLILSNCRLNAIEIGDERRGHGRRKVELLKGSTSTFCSQLLN